MGCKGDANEQATWDGNMALQEVPRYQWAWLEGVSRLRRTEAALQPGVRDGRSRIGEPADVSALGSDAAGEDSGGPEQPAASPEPAAGLAGGGRRFIVTRYGVEYDGLGTACGSVYRSADPGIAAVCPGRFPCGTRLVLTRPGVPVLWVEVRDTGPGLCAVPAGHAGWIDLSEAGMAALCGLDWSKGETCDYLDDVTVEVLP